MAGSSCWGWGWGSFEDLEKARRLPSRGSLLSHELPGPRLLVTQQLSMCLCPCCLWTGPSAPVLSIHKLPASGATDISFPMKGWRATGDWAKVPEDRVTVSKSVFSTGLAGEGPQTAGGALTGHSGPGV